MCFNSSYLFGCVSLKKHNFCILNKDYGSEEAFNTEKKKLIEHMKKTGEWGEFFPHELSPFAYNESIADSYFPLSKEEVTSRGWLWRDDDTKTKGKETIKLENIPDISQINDDILKEVLACKKCQTNYKLLKPELDLYKQLNVQIPHRCPHCRNLDQINKLDPLNLWHRQCMCTQPEHGHEGQCKNEFETTYSPERKELIYCEDCYNKEIY